MTGNNSNGGQSSGASNLFASAPTIQPFNPDNDQWVLYKERLENFFKVSNVADELKAAFLLNAIGPAAYKVVRDMCFPTTPSEKPYNDICKIL